LTASGSFKDILLHKDRLVGASAVFSNGNIADEHIADEHIMERFGLIRGTCCKTELRLFRFGD